MVLLGPELWDSEWVYHIMKYRSMKEAAESGLKWFKTSKSQRDLREWKEARVPQLRKRAPLSFHSRKCVHRTPSPLDR